MKTKPLITLTTIVCSVAVSAAATAESNDELPVWTPKARTLSVFKNGLGFIIKDGQTELKDGWARTEQLPTAALGALWIGAKGNSVSEVVAYKEMVTEETEAISQAELLAANVGRPVILTHIVGGTTRTLRGVLLSVPADRKPDEPGTIEVAMHSAYRPYPSAPRLAELVLLRVSTNGQSTIVSVNKNAIQEIELPGDATTKTKRAKEVSRARIRVAGNPPAAELTMASLQKGILWSPSYRVDIVNEQKAGLTLEAVLANDAEDLEDVEVSFVVGYPNFLYADVVSPLSLQQSVTAFIQALSSGRSGAPRDRIMSQSVLYNVAAYNTGIPGEATYSATQAMPGETGTDLFFYRQAGVTLKKGERARYTVFEAAVPYEHIYRWEVADNMNVDSGGHRRNPGTSSEAENQVWHTLRLENTTQQPWTTAPAFTVNNAKPAAQDVLNYAPPGSKTSLRLTVATDLRAEQFQTEIARKIVGVFDEVTVQGKLKLTSRKHQETQLLISKSLVGEIMGENEGKVTKVARQLNSVNPNSEIEWEFELGPGKIKELSYQYKVLIRR